MPLIKNIEKSLFEYLSKHRTGIFFYMRVQTTVALFSTWLQFSHRKGGGPALSMVCQADLDEATGTLSMRGGESCYEYCMMITYLAELFHDLSADEEVSEIIIAPAPLAVTPASDSGYETTQVTHDWKHKMASSADIVFPPSFGGAVPATKRTSDIVKGLRAALYDLQATDRYRHQREQSGIQIRMPRSVHASGPDQPQRECEDACDSVSSYHSDTSDSGSNDEGSWVHPLLRAISAAGDTVKNPILAEKWGPWSIAPIKSNGVEVGFVANCLRHFAGNSFGTADVRKNTLWLWPTHGC